MVRPLERVTMSTKQQQTERDEAIERLRSMLDPGDTVYTVMRHVSASGMTRWIDAYVIHDDTPLWLSFNAALATGYTFDRKREAVKLEGCGMDMGFALVYAISRAVFADGFDCLEGADYEAERAAWLAGNGPRPADCPSNDHCNRVQATHHDEGGYALKHRWLG